MRWKLAVATLIAASAISGSEAVAQAPLYDPVILNIGFVCRWNAHCMDKQKDAMNRALKFVRKKDPPTWRIQRCNKNAGKRGSRIDWIGFDNCIRNVSLAPLPQRPIPKPRKRPSSFIAERGH